jgi:diguanylate cyclase (GGDEF)-like protein/PAS domain S-box-containing protein
MAIPPDADRTGLAPGRQAPPRSPSDGAGAAVRSRVPDPAPEPDPTVRCVLVRNEAAVIVAADGATEDILGWDAPELVGNASTSFIHPEDQPSAVAAWFEMLGQPGAVVTWRGRYRGRDGAWRWVETTNTNHLDDPVEPRVISSFVRVTAHEVGIEEELRARKQLLAQLSDALPVGLFQIDRNRHITFANDRLSTIIGAGEAATIDAQFAALLPSDRGAFEAALGAVLTGDTVDDVELRLWAGDESAPTVRVCRLSLRSLTDTTETVTGAIGCLSDVTDSVRLRYELELRASIDSLTGCLNRAATVELLELRLREHRRGRGLAVMYIDLDDFKHVNDRYGHAAGDAVLVRVVELAKDTVRAGDEVGRLGGDEFLVICPDVANERDAYDLGERLRRSLHGILQLESNAIGFQASIGVVWTDEETSVDALIARADSAMYSTKSSLHAPGHARIA